METSLSVVKRNRTKWIWIGFFLAIVASMINAFSYIEHSVQFAFIALAGRALVTGIVALILTVAFCVLAWLFQRRMSFSSAATIFSISWAIMSFILIIPSVTRSSPNSMLYLFSY